MNATLENHMLATLDGNDLTFDTDFGRSEARRITLDYFAGFDAEGGAVELSISAHHIKGGTYAVRVDRHIRKDGILTWRARKDTYYANYSSMGTRYSSKNLEAVTAKFFEERTQASNISTQSMVNWVNELVA